MFASISIFQQIEVNTVDGRIGWASPMVLKRENRLANRPIGGGLQVNWTGNGNFRGPTFRA
jgi:hypothetical protein|tara:strand:+ start:508 stop:690 length:183 start_codon:yes stop_codon:yes gene_type:complete